MPSQLWDLLRAEPLLPVLREPDELVARGETDNFMGLVAFASSITGMGFHQPG